MSYWANLTQNGKNVEVDRHQESGTFVAGGTLEATLNVTYNYSRYYATSLGSEGLLWLDGKRAAETVDKLESAVETLGTKRAHDYWESTEGNAGYALSILLSWARQHPEAVWMIR